MTWGIGQHWMGSSSENSGCYPEKCVLGPLPISLCEERTEIIILMRTAGKLHLLCVCVCVCVCVHAQSRLTLCEPMDWMGLVESSRQEYWSQCHFLLQRIFPIQGLNPFSAWAGRFFTTVLPRKPSNLCTQLSKSLSYRREKGFMVCSWPKDKWDNITVMVKDHLRQTTLVSFKCTAKWFSFLCSGGQGNLTCCSPCVHSQTQLSNWMTIYMYMCVYTHTHTRGFPGHTSGNKPACQCRRHKRQGVYSWVGKIPWRRAWQPNPAFLPGESHGQRSLAGYSPMGSQTVGHALATK